jgi:hypothetical protein
VAGVHAFEVFVDTVQNNILGVFLTFIGFAPFKALDTVVKSGVCRVEFERLNRLDDRSLPSTVVLIVVAVEHVVGGDASEDVLMVARWFGEEILPLMNNEVFCVECLISSAEFSDATAQEPVLCNLCLSELLLKKDKLQKLQLTVLLRMFCSFMILL